MSDDKGNHKKWVGEEKKVVGIEKVNIGAIIRESKITAKGADIE